MSSTCISALRQRVCSNPTPLGKNAVYVLFTWDDSWRNVAEDQWFSIPKDSIYHIKHNIHTPFYPSSGLTRNWMFNGSIYMYYVLYLQILRFYLVWQNITYVLMFYHSSLSPIWNINLLHYWIITPNVILRYLLTIRPKCTFCRTNFLLFS